LGPIVSAGWPSAGKLDAAAFRDWLRANSNWGRWGEDDQVGAVNLVTDEKRVEAARSVRLGRSVSLARPLATKPGPDNPQPVQHFLRWFHRGPGEGGGAGEYLGLHVHGYQGTHVDALCHAWGDRGMWNGRDPAAELTPQGARWGGIEQWRHGIVTRGVLLDITRHRREAHVAADRPVRAEELADVEAAQGVQVTAGDALVVYAGREALEARPGGWNPHTDAHPGLSVTALRYLRERDVAVLLWDLMDAQPFEIGWPLVPHAALYELGIPLVDNCALAELADLAAAHGRYDFQLTLAPLVLPGGTGSPVNPIALL